MNSVKIQESELLQRILKPLLAWYEKNRRELEWRQKPLPYYVWVSEIMLQQTRVEAVKPYFSRFIRQLPSVRDLALCEENRLLKLWEGLGYYSRVRNLQKAARIVMQQYGGELPADEKTLRSLPGIGSYTAGAIASIAFGLPAPAVDGNVLRVLSRILGSEACIDEPLVKKEFENRIRECYLRMADCTHRSFSPGAYNQALMELGAVICLPNGSPLCDQCPVRHLCRARSRHLIGQIPVRKQKAKRRREKKTVLIIRDQDRVLIRKRPDTGLLAGLWELPNVAGHLTADEAIEKTKELGVQPVRIRALPEEKHIFTHIEWEMTGYLILVEEMDSDSPEAAGSVIEGQVPGQSLTSGCIAVNLQKVQEEYSIPSAFGKYVSWLGIDRLSELKSQTEALIHLEGEV